VVITNAVLCLPAFRKGKYPVSRRQLEKCLPWLERLITDVDPTVVVTCGRQALKAVNRLEAHGLTLGQHAGQPRRWFGRSLLPLYHPGGLGRANRSPDKQLSDIEALLPFLAGEAV
jgi:uracil-DNA glycosylase